MESNTFIDKPKRQVVPQNTASGYKVVNIFLIESSFIRKEFIHFESPEENDLKIDTEVRDNESENKILVGLVLKFVGRFGGENACEANIKMIGMFEKYGEPAVSEESFKTINAPAIIYPFIREHLHSLCMKAGIGTIFLPTVNFKI